MRVFASGDPRLTSSSLEFSKCDVDQTQVSVGPYMLQTLPDKLLVRRLASAAGRASPPTNMHRIPSSKSWRSKSIRASEGVHCRWVGVHSNPANGFSDRRLTTASRCRLLSTDEMSTPKSI